MKFVFGEDVQSLYPNVMLTIERISPADAMEMLQVNVRNRDPKREAITQAIKRGEWMMNGETIIFDENGVLLDGQNRLMSVVKAGKPIDTVVVRGIKAVAQFTMDQGIKRQFMDELKMRGYKDIVMLQSITIGLVRADEHGLNNTSRNGIANGGITIPMLTRFFDENYKTRIRPIVPDVRSICKKYRGIPRGRVAALLDTLKTRADPDDYVNYVMQLNWSLDAKGTMAILKQRLIENSMCRTGRLPEDVVIALMIKSWNAYVTGNELKFLRYRQGGANPEAFPEIVIPE